jgi:hypothetical protein
MLQMAKISSSIVRLGACPVCHDPALEALPPPTRWIAPAVFAPFRESFGLSRCRACGFVFTNPRPSPALIEAARAGRTPPPRAAEVDQARADLLLERLEPCRRFPEPGRLLHFGCGSGWLLRRARERGWEAAGFEGDAAALRDCWMDDLDVSCVLEAFSGRTFDAVVIDQALECAFDLDAVLARLRPLVEGGRLVVHVSNGRSLRARLSRPWFGRRLPLAGEEPFFPAHLNHFDPRTLARLLERHRFAVDSLTTQGSGFEDWFQGPPGVRGAVVRDLDALDASGRPWLVRAFHEARLGGTLLATARVHKADRRAVFLLRRSSSPGGSAWVPRGRPRVLA